MKQCELYRHQQRKMSITVSILCIFVVFENSIYLYGKWRHDSEPKAASSQGVYPLNVIVRNNAYLTEIATHKIESFKYYLLIVAIK